MQLFQISGSKLFLTRPTNLNQGKEIQPLIEKNLNKDDFPVFPSRKSKSLSNFHLSLTAFRHYQRKAAMQTHLPQSSLSIN